MSNRGRQHGLVLGMIIFLEQLLTGGTVQAIDFKVNGVSGVTSLSQNAALKQNLTPDGGDVLPHPNRPEISGGGRSFDLPDRNPIFLGKRPTSLLFAQAQSEPFPNRVHDGVSFIDSTVPVVGGIGGSHVGEGALVPVQLASNDSALSASPNLPSSLPAGAVPDVGLPKGVNGTLTPFPEPPGVEGVPGTPGPSSQEDFPALASTPAMYFSTKYVDTPGARGGCLMTMVKGGSGGSPTGAPGLSLDPRTKKTGVKLNSMGDIAAQLKNSGEQTGLAQQQRDPAPSGGEGCYAIMAAHCLIGGISSKQGTGSFPIEVEAKAIGGKAKAKAYLHGAFMAKQNAPSESDRHHPRDIGLLAFDSQTCQRIKKPALPLCPGGGGLEGARLETISRHHGRMPAQLAPEKILPPNSAVSVNIQGPGVKVGDSGGPLIKDGNCIAGVLSTSPGADKGHSPKATYAALGALDFIRQVLGGKSVASAKPPAGRPHRQVAEQTPGSAPEKLAPIPGGATH